MKIHMPRSLGFRRLLDTVALLFLIIGLSGTSLAQFEFEVTQAVSLWREWMSNIQKEPSQTTKLRLYLTTEREILQTGPETAQFQNGRYSFMLADGIVPDTDGDRDGYTDVFEDVSNGGNRNDPDAVPVDGEGNPIQPPDAHILPTLLLGNGDLIRIANSTSLTNQGTTIDPKRGNQVVRTISAPASTMQRPMYFNDFSGEFYYIDPTTGYSNQFPLALYYVEREFPNPQDASAMEREIVPGPYQVEYPTLYNRPIGRSAIGVTHYLVPNGAMTQGLKVPTWIIRSLKNDEKLGKPPITQSWVNGRLKFDPYLPVTVTWDSLAGLASALDFIELRVRDENGIQISYTSIMGANQMGKTFDMSTPMRLLRGNIRDFLGTPGPPLAFDGEIEMRYYRLANQQSRADLSSVLVRVPIRLEVSYASWRLDMFPQSFTNESIAGPNADPDGDGLTNFQEYQQGSDPTVPVIAIVNPTSQDITVNSAALGATVQADPFSSSLPTIIERGVVYSPSFVNPFPLLDGPAVVRVQDAFAESGTFTVVASGLTDNTQYSYCGYVITNQGTYYTSPVSIFTTPALPPITLPTMTSLTIGNVAATTAILGATVDADGGSPVTARGIVYSVTSTNDNPFIGGPGVTNVPGGSGTGTFTVNASGLAPSTTYSFRAYATNALGTSYTTAIGTFSTASLPVVTSPTFTNITSTSALLGGNVTSSGGLPILQRGVVFSRTSVNGNPIMGGNGVSAFAASSTGTGVFTVNVTGLAPNTAYSFKAYAINAVGTAYTTAGTFTTLGTLPTVSSPTIASLTSSSVRLGANVTSNGGLTLIERGFVYAPTAVNSNPTIGGAGVIPVIASGTTTGAYFSDITGLMPNTGYTFKPFARNSAGVAYGAPYAFFTTLPPLTVTSPTAASITETSAVLGGTVASDSGTIVTERGVIFSITNPDPVIGGPGVLPKVTASGTMGVFTVPVSGLSSGTDYYFRAYAINGAGTSYSQVATFKTLPLILAGSPAVEWVTMQAPAAPVQQSLPDDGSDQPIAMAMTEPELIKVPEFVYQKAPEELGKPISFEVETTEDFVHWAPINQDIWVVEDLEDRVHATWNSTEVSPPERIFFRVQGTIK